MPAHIVPIVEGHGEVAAVPLLIRRIAFALGIHDCVVGKPVRCPRDRIPKAGELERAIELAVQKAEAAGQILILLDSNDHCPATLGPDIVQRATEGRVGYPIEVVLAKKEYEAWFLGSVESIKPGAVAIESPEEIRGAKERLAESLGVHYSETIDQPALTVKFDMELARRNCPSFDKCWRAVERLLNAARVP